jgi:hypothetical protein
MSTIFQDVNQIRKDADAGLSLTQTASQEFTTLVSAFKDFAADFKTFAADFHAFLILVQPYLPVPTPEVTGVEPVFSQPTPQA